MKECTCKDWKEYMRKLTGILTTVRLRTGSGYDGKPFQYCPWCGTKCKETE